MEKMFRKMMGFMETIGFFPSFFFRWKKHWNFGAKQRDFRWLVLGEPQTLAVLATYWWVWYGRYASINWIQYDHFSIQIPLKCWCYWYIDFGDCWCGIWMVNVHCKQSCTQYIQNHSDTKCYFSRWGWHVDCEYPAVIKHSYGTSPFVYGKTHDFNGHFPVRKLLVITRG